MTTMTVSGGRADNHFFLLLSCIVIFIQIYAKLERGIALQPPNPPASSVHRRRAAAVWTAKTAFIPFTPAGRCLHFLLAQTINGPLRSRRGGSSPIPEILDLVGGKIILSLAMQFIGWWSGSPGGVFVLSWSCFSFPIYPNLFFGEFHNPLSHPILWLSESFWDFSPSLTAWIKLVPGSCWFFNFIFPNPPQPSHPCQPCSLFGFHHYLINY